MARKTPKQNYGTKTNHASVSETNSDTVNQPGCGDLLDALPFYVLVVDEHHNIVMANRAVTEHLGVNPIEIIGRFCPEAIHGTKEPWYACPLEEAVESDSAVVREAQDQKTGRWMNSAMYPVPGSHFGKKVYFHMVTDITDRKAAEENLEASREQLKELSQHLLTVREEERASIAREIHDDLGQTLVTLKIYISWLLRRLSKAEETAPEQTRSIYSLIDSAINTVMRLSTELRPGALDDLGLAPAIEWQINELKKWTDIEYHFVSRPRLITLERESATALYRVAHEALTNVIRHARATRVDISLNKTAKIVKLSIVDNGKGIDELEVNNPRAFGLIGMRERLQILGGELKIHGEPGKGTLVEIILPVTQGVPAKRLLEKKSLKG